MRLRLLIAGAVLGLLLWAALPLTSEGAPRASSASLSRKIARTQGKLRHKRRVAGVLTSQVTTYSRKVNALQDNITSLQQRESLIQGDLDAKRAELVRLRDELRSERARLARLRGRLARGRRLLAARLVELYESQQPDIVTVILTSNGFADLLERGEFISRVNDQDAAIISAVTRAKADATSSARHLAALQARQQKVTQIVLARRNEVASVRGGLVDRRSGYAQARDQRQSVLSHVRSDTHDLEGALDDYRAEQAKIAGALGGGGALPAGPIKHGSGQLIWPVNGPITSPFCERRSYEACHPGVDIGVPSGTPIRAAGSGRVALIQSEGESGGYGNYTCLQHTRALATCYAHQSRITVSVGQSVRQGQVIGYTGCTGRCFGPHLHFEVRINGQVTNPLDYL